MKTINPKDAMNRRQDERLIVETAIYRVFCLNRTVLDDVVLPINSSSGFKPEGNRSH
ncbi:MAG: hypothetical protein V7L11_26565 [Nostoc sp.]|uniref:hypothetical protein n=1 Tax=Nostoc sp. TaxID=1180 RepID=UPI002FF9FB18